MSAIVAGCSDVNHRYVRKAVRLMDIFGIYAQGPEWNAAKQAALEADPTSLEEAQQVVWDAGKVAGGKHTFVMTAGRVQKDDEAEWEMPSVEQLDGGILHIKLPPFSGNSSEGKKYALTVLDAINGAPRGVVVDLRGNRGGNMYPMIAAVHRFLPDDDILKFRTRRRTMTINLDYVTLTAGVDRQPYISCPVAILTDEGTGSSGEATLLCFRGLDYTRSFGAPTAGYASSNQSFALPDGAKLVLTIGDDIARTGEEFCDDPIVPDVVTETPMEAALEWLQSFNK